MYLLTREKPWGHKESGTSERTRTQRQYYQYSSEYCKGSLPFICMYTILYDLVLRTRIQHFSDLRRKYDNMCLSAHGCYFFSSEEYNYSDIGGYGFSLFYMQLHTHMCTHIYIYTHTHTRMVEFFLWDIEYGRIF